MDGDTVRVSVSVLVRGSVMAVRVLEMVMDSTWVTVDVMVRLRDGETDDDRVGCRVNVAVLLSCSVSDSVLVTVADDDILRCPPLKITVYVGDLESVRVTVRIWVLVRVGDFVTCCVIVKVLVVVMFFVTVLGVRETVIVCVLVSVRPRVKVSKETED